MTPHEIVLQALDAIERSGVDYLIVGALAVNAYTFSRSTKDADFVLRVGMSGSVSVYTEERHPLNGITHGWHQFLAWFDYL